MDYLPEVKHRDIGRMLREALEARQAVHVGIAEVAQTHSDFLDQRDRELNATQRVTRAQ
jgi:hypothetical protein